MEYKIRALSHDDESTLWEMLYQALHLEGGEAPSREVLQRPEIARYVVDWGREGDAGFIAFDDEEEGTPLGAVWFRLPVGQHKGFGYLGDEVPELAFAVVPGHRRRGIGTALLTRLMTANPDKSAISLTVDDRHPVLRLYERFGFETLGTKEGRVILKRAV